MNNSKYKSYMDRLTNEFSNHTYTCKCGHRIVITAQKEKKLCNWCNKFVFKNKKDEFKYRTIEQLRRLKYDR